MGQPSHHALVLKNGRRAAGEASAWARTVVKDHGVPAEQTEALDLCIVELVANITDHGYGDAPGEVRLALVLAAHRLTLTIEDDGPAFDPLQQATPQQAGSLEEAQIGGLGIHLVRQFASDCRYQRTGHTNHLEVMFDTDATHAATN